MSVRTYSTDEHAAFKRANRHFNWQAGGGYKAGEGPAEYASGRYWPDHMRAEAARLERLIPYLRLAADALEREIAADPRCTTEETL